MVFTCLSKIYVILFSYVYYLRQTVKSAEVNRYYSKTDDKKKLGVSLGQEHSPGNTFVRINIEIS